jgi:hypothetical protein
MSAVVLWGDEDQDSTREAAGLTEESGIFRIFATVHNMYLHSGRTTFRTKARRFILADDFIFLEKSLLCRTINSLPRQ